MFIGNGSTTTGTFRTVEGALDIHIKHQTNANAAYMSVRIECDTNGDGIWGSGRDAPSRTVWHGAYGSLKNLDTVVTHSFYFYGGTTRFVVEAPGAWQIKVTPKPYPRRTIHAVIREEGVRNGSGTGSYLYSKAARVVATSARGDRFEAMADAIGGCELKVYGDTDYVITASKEQYKTARVAFPVRRFSERDNAGWPMKVDLYLPYGTRLKTVERDTPEAKTTSVFGTVTYKASGKPVRHELVALVDGKTGKRMAKQEIRGSAGAKFEFEKLAPGDYSLHVGGAIAPYTDRSATAYVRGLKEGERREVNLQLEPASVTVQGNVYALVSRNRQKVIKYAKVRVKFSDGKAIDTATDYAGRYEAKHDRTPESYRVFVELADKDSIVTVQDHSGFGGALVKMQTRPQKIDQPYMRTNIFFMSTYFETDPTHTVAQKQAFRHTGAYYANLIDAVDFGRKTLGETYNYKLPVDNKLFAPTPKSVVAYNMATSTITVSRLGGNSVVSVMDSPDNREHHEFGHHVHSDATMGGANSPNTRPKNDNNHGSVNNSSSLDSVNEGFAEFYSMLVRNSSYYRWTGVVSNLQKNTHMIPGANLPDEEFNVAALLWDIYDKDTEPGDYFALGAKGTWAILNQAKVKTVRDIYEVMDARYRKQDSNKKDGLNDVDALFVAHNFFGDTDGDRVFDKGEKPGYADQWNHTAGSTTYRRYREALPGTLLQAETVDAEGKPVDVPVYRTRVVYDDDTRDEPFTTAPVGTDPVTIRVWVPYQAKVEVTPVVPGFRAEPYVLAYDAYSKAVSAANKAGKGFFGSHKFQLEPNGVSPAGNVCATSTDEGVRLSWELGPEVIIVRRVDALPMSPEDGMIVATTAAGEFVDKEVLEMEGAPLYYAFFVRGLGDAVSKPVHVALGLPEPEGEEASPRTAEAGVQTNAETEAKGGDDNASWLVPLLVFAVGVLAVVLVAFRRKVNQQTP